MTIVDPASPNILSCTADKKYLFCYSPFSEQNIQNTIKIPTVSNYQHELSTLYMKSDWAIPPPPAPLPVAFL